MEFRMTQKYNVVVKKKMLITKQAVNVVILLKDKIDF